MVYTLERDEKAHLWVDSLQPLGLALRAGIPQINRAVRLHDTGVTVQHKNKVFNESIRFVDKGFLDMFSFPLKSGNRSTLYEQNSLILSENMAKKYFGQDDPVGQQVILTFNKTHKEEFIVKGVAEKFPHNASFSFNFLASFNNCISSYDETSSGAYESWSKHRTDYWAEILGCH